MNRWIIGVGTAWICLTTTVIISVSETSLSSSSDQLVAMCDVPVVSTNEGSVQTYFSTLFSTAHWPARWTCGDWSQGEGWMYIISDLTIFLSYLSIPIMLLWYMRNKVLGNLRWIIALFSAFILLCGFTHLIDAVIFWEPVYRLSGFSKLLTGLVSMTTAIVLGFVFRVLSSTEVQRIFLKLIPRRKYNL